MSFATLQDPLLPFFLLPTGQHDGQIFATMPNELNIQAFA
jgi:hypothetical protein